MAVILNSKFSQFPLAADILATDIVVGLRGAVNYRFKVSNLRKDTYQAINANTVLATTNSSYLFEFRTAATNLSDASGLAAYENGFNFVLKNTSGGNCAFTPKAGEFIDGAASLTLTNGQGVHIYKTPTQWTII